MQFSSCAEEQSLLRSDGDGTDKDAVLQKDAEDEEHKVQNKHGDAQHFAHLPATCGNRNDDEEEHEEEQHDSTEQAVGADRHWFAVVEESINEPRDGKSETDRLVHKLHHGNQQ